MSTHQYPIRQPMHPVLARIYAARGALDSDLDYSLRHLLPPNTLGGIDAACALLHDALRKQTPIIVCGDYDADGCTAVAIAVRGLRMFGATVDYCVPNRLVHGYGLSPAMIDDLPHVSDALLVTVDNGIAAHAGIDAAKARGFSVLVTDHHLQGDTLPSADAIVNPNVRGDPFGSRALAGCGVMFYVLLALRAHLRHIGWFRARVEPEPDLSWLLDLVAVGTLGDVVPLDYNNRILVHAGMQRIRTGRACAGIKALLYYGRNARERVTTSDINFQVVPRLNAAGRLEDMRIGIECLLTDDPARAGELAATLDAINSERKEIQSHMVEQAEAAVASSRAVTAKAVALGVVLFSPDWHIGVVGLVASRIKDRLRRPVIAFALGNDNMLKGSGRSIAGFHLRDALALVDARHPGCIEKFGGHAMAAGLSIHRDNLLTFTAAFDDIARELLTADLLKPGSRNDGELSGDDFSLDLAEQIRAGGPWGQGFPAPVFVGRFEVCSYQVLTGKHLKMSLLPDAHGREIDAIAFNAFTGETLPRRIYAHFALDVNEWRDRRRVQLLVQEFAPS